MTQQHMPGHFLIKEKNSGQQEKEGYGIINEVVEIGMNER
jgi:hypothetical protein